MFGLSFPELIIVLVIALLVLGPERLPKVAKTIGKTMRDVRRTTSEFKDMVEGEFHAIEQSVEGKPEREGGAPEGVAAGHTGAGIPAAPSGAPALRPAGALPAAGIAMHRLDEAAQAEDPSPLHAHAAFAGEAGASPDRSAAGASAGAAGSRAAGEGAAVAGAPASEAGSRAAGDGAAAAGAAAGEAGSRADVENGPSANAHGVAVAAATGQDEAQVRAQVPGDSSKDA